MRVGILTGGGDCPGLNAVIRAAVRKGIFHYGDEFVGFDDEFITLPDGTRRRRYAEDYQAPLHEYEAFSADQAWMPTVVLVAKKNKAFEWLGSLPIPGVFNGHHYFRIEELSNGQVKFIQGEDFSGLLAGLIMRQIGEQTRQGFIAMNKALKERAES